MASLVMVPVFSYKEDSQKDIKSLLLESVICNLDTEKFGSISMVGEVPTHLNLLLMRKLHNCNTSVILVDVNPQNNTYSYVTDLCSFANLQFMVEDFAQKYGLSVKFSHHSLMNEIEAIHEDCLKIA